MVFLSSLVHALRESAERAIAHVRPPGPIKHGGAAPWKQHLRPFSSSASHHIHAQPDTKYVRYDHYPPSAKSLKDPIHNIFRIIHKHAIKPVFTDFQTGNATFTETSFLRRPQTKFNSGGKRPVLKKNVGQVGLQLAHQRGHAPASAQYWAPYIWSPGLGLRAALDELEDEIRSRGRVVENTPRSEASPCRSMHIGSTVKKSKPFNFFERIPHMEADAYRDDNDSMPCTLDGDYCDTCSSSYIAGVVSLPESSASDDDYDDVRDTFAEPEQEPIRVITTLQVPMSPDLFRLLAGNVLRQETEPEDELDYLLEQIQRTVDDYNAFRLNVLVPLERGLQDGPLSVLDPQGWNAGQLIWDNAEGRHLYLPVTFLNRTRHEVLEMLRYSVGLRLYRILEEFVTEDWYDRGNSPAIMRQHDEEDDDDGDDDTSITGTEQGSMDHFVGYDDMIGAAPGLGDYDETERYQENRNGDYYLTAKDLTMTDEDEEDQEDGVESPTEDYRSTHDDRSELDRIAEASFGSQEHQHIQGSSTSYSPFVQSILADSHSNTVDFRFPLIHIDQGNDLSTTHPIM